MKISILTTLTNPTERQDKWIEALSNYLEFADEVVVVNGGKPIVFVDVKPNPKLRIVEMPWPYVWNWVELPHHLNFGLQYCGGDWIIKLDIDQFIHERHYDELRQKLAECPDECYVATMQKMSFTYAKKYYQKGEQPVCFRNKEFIKIGKDINKRTDLCFPVDTRNIKGFETVAGKILYLGTTLPTYKTGVKYFNYDYFFKTQEFTKEEFWRFSQAYYDYFKEWTFGDSKERAFEVFINMLRGRHERAPYTEDDNTHSKWIKQAVAQLTPEQFGYNGWGLI